MPTVHPAFVLRSPSYWPAFVADIKKAKAFADGTAEPPIRPPIKIAESTEDVRDFFEHTNGKPVACDTETSRAHPMVARLKCIGFSCAGSCCVGLVSCRSVVVPIVRGDNTPYWSLEDFKAVMGIIAKAFNTEVDFDAIAGTGLAALYGVTSFSVGGA